MEKVETGLTLGVTPEFGTALIAEAAKANQEKLKLKVIGKVGSLLEEIEEQKKEIAIQQAELTRLEKMASALQSGQFTITSAGEIEYSDPTVSDISSWRYRCSKCGNESFVLSSHKAAQVQARR